MPAIKGPGSNCNAIPPWCARRVCELIMGMSESNDRSYDIDSNNHT